MATVDTARTIIGVIGNVISFALFASPCPTFWRIVKNKSTEEFKPDPYVATVLNCLFWIFYGLPIVHPNSTLVVTINSVGLAMEIAYLIIFLIYGNNKQRLRIAAWLCIELVFFAAMAVITLVRFHTHDARSNFVGILCVIFGIMMYFSPLTIMKKVIQSRSVEFMPFYLSLTNFLNGAVWVTYALLRFDLYITIANGLGAVSGAIQLILYAVYYKSTPKKNLPKPSAVNEVQLPRLPTANTPINEV